MLRYIAYRFAYMALILLIVSVITFIIIQLPPGDILTVRVAQLQQGGTTVGEAEIAALKQQYGLNLPMWRQYFKWVFKMLHGDFGMSFSRNVPVNTLIAERLPLTLIISVMALLFTYALAIPIGIYSAVRQYSIGDYLVSVVGFLGLSIPNFLLALIVMLGLNKWFGLSVGGLFSSEYIVAPWSFARVLDLLKHLPAPVIIIGVSGTAWNIRVMRGCLLDELRKQYVTTARAKGVDEVKLLFKYPVRLAINPIISTISWQLPQIFSGVTIVAIVLNLPTIGPLLFDALISQDMFLAGSIVMILSALTVLGTFLSDIMLAVLDPRIRYD